jgi:indole-3-acetate monooxygenase
VDETRVPPTSTELIEAARALRPLVAAASEQIDRERDIPKPIIRQMADAGIFGMGVPAAYGGTASDLVTKMTVIEEISAGNGSAGWIAMIAIGAPTFTVALDPDAAAEVFRPGPGVPLAGAAAPVGKGVAVQGGFLLSGRWRFASGSANARWMFAGFSVDSERPEEPPTRLRALIPKDAVRIIDTWQTVGLRGTGSYDFEVAGALVPSKFCSAAFAPSRQPDVLFRLPSTMVLTVEHTSHALGMARGALDAFIELCARKVSGASGPLVDQAFAHDVVGRAEAKLSTARGAAYEAVRWAYGRAEADDPPQLVERARYRLEMVSAAHAAGDVIDSVYHAAGGDALYDTSPLGRFFRDWHTASQHIQLSPALYATAGRVLLGIDPPPPGW